MDLFRKVWVWLLLRPLGSLFYRLQVRGREHLPQDGAILAGNHLSIVDTLFLRVALGPRAVFLVGESVSDDPWTRAMARLLRLVTLPRGADAAALEGVRQTIQARAAAGDWVVVPANKRLEAGGAEVPWDEDFSSLTNNAGPLLPLHLDRLWEMVYTFDGNAVEFTKKRRFRFRFPVYIVIGEPFPAGVSGAAVRTALRTLGTDWRMQRPLRYPVLRRWYLATARERLRKRAVADNIRGELSHLRLLAGSIAFGRVLRKRLDGEPMVGVLLPPSLAGTLANVTLHLMGKSPINLNYTLNTEAMASCAGQCGLKHVLTSRLFLERIGIEAPCETILLEEVKNEVSGMDRLLGLLMALCAPAPWIDRALGAEPGSPEDIATVIFSSGSEGEPKGVVLTERNILANIESVMEVLPRHKGTVFVGFLPFFHSFGYTVTLWLPLLEGVAAVYHPNPLEPKVIGDLIERYKGTFLCGTSTFLQGFVRRCDAKQLRTLEFVVAGAEKLSPRVRTSFKEKFGVEPLEGYGMTECAPVVSVNLPDLCSPGFYYESTRHGSIGRAIPGVDLRVADAETGAPVPLGDSGMLEVRGPNRMREYLGQPGKTAAVLREAWYVSGDIAYLDGDGFAHITDRLSRFSKIAGEMVPHTRVEEALHELAGLDYQAMAVTSVPDPAKGERLVVLHILEAAPLAELCEKLQASGLPNLWRPKANAFFRVDAIPVLGTGKLDIRSVKQSAAELAGATGG